MKIGALQKVTLVDYPGKIALTVFATGCNFKCPFCHNPNLICGQKENDLIRIEENFLLDFLKKRRGLVDGVVISGGEPTIQPELIDFIKKIKKENFLVKLDTNGSNPFVLENLFQEKLLDYVAMDIKCSLEKYSQVANSFVAEKIKKSINLIKNSNIDYEFRTTIAPRIINEEEIEKIGKAIREAKAFYLQQFRNEIALNKDWQKVRPYADERLKDMAKIIEPFVEKVGVRGI